MIKRVVVDFSTQNSVKIFHHSFDSTEFDLWSVSQILIAGSLPYLSLTSEWDEFSKPPTLGVP